MVLQGESSALLEHSNDWNRNMPDRCPVHGCNNRSDMNVGISDHFSPQDTWLRFVQTHRANFNRSGKFLAGRFSPFRRGMLL